MVIPVLSWIDWFTRGSAFWVTSAVLAVVSLALIVAAPLRWRRHFAARAARVAGVRELTSKHYQQRPHHSRGREIYAFAPKLALEVEEPSRPQRLAGRAGRVAQLETGEIEKLLGWARSWIATVGRFADEAQARRLPLKVFFRQMHVSVITEGVFFWPVLAYGWRTARWTDEERHELLWGLTLMELAVRYNRLAPVQRKAIYLNAGKLTIGPIIKAGPRRFLLWFDLLFLLDDFRLTNFGKAGFRRIESLMLDVVDQIDVPEGEPVTSATGPQPGRRSIFVSHAATHEDGQGDGAVTARLVELLEGKGLSCWVAPRDCRGHRDYDDEIREGIDAADAVVLVFSDVADRRPAVKKELLMAADRGTPILVVRIEPAKAIKLEYVTKAATWRDWFHGDDSQLEPLVSDLREIVGSRAD